MYLVSTCKWAARSHFGLCNALRHAIVMWTLESFLEDLRAMQSLLGEFRSPGLCSRFSEQEARMATTVLTKMRAFRPDMRSKLAIVEELRNGAWSEAVKANLIETLASDEHGCGCGSRNQTQTLTRPLAFLKDVDVAFLKDPNNTMRVKMYRLANALRVIGVSNPSEQTIQKAVGALLLLDQGEGALRSDPHAKLLTLIDFKKTFALSRRQRCHACVNTLNNLRV